MAKKINFKSKSLWKKIGLGVLAGVVLIGAVFGVTALFRKAEEETQKEISPSWAIGGLTEDGAYLETKESIYTKDAFECKGLNIKMDFDNNISYRIFFYDYNDDFVSSTENLTTNYSEDVDLFVKSARIVITPNEDSKISWYEKSGYAKQLTISVDKDQDSLPKTYEINMAGIEKVKGILSTGSDGVLMLRANDEDTNSLLIPLEFLKQHYGTITLYNSNSYTIQYCLLQEEPEFRVAVADILSMGHSQVGTSNEVISINISTDANYLIIQNSVSGTSVAPSSIVFSKI